MPSIPRIYNCNINISPAVQQTVGEAYKYNKKAFLDPVTNKLPESKNLLQFCPPIYDQGSLGACTGFASSSMREIIQRIAGKEAPQLSPLFIYYFERCAEKTVATDSGASLTDALWTLLQRGDVPIDLDPYSIETFRTRPDKKLDKVAQDFKILSAKHLHSLQDLKTCIAEGFPFVGGITVFQSFESPEVARTGNVPMPDTSREQVLGGHAVCFVGYDDSSQTFLVRNSWGHTWGTNGYFRLPYSYVQNINLANDFWTARI